MIPANVAIVPTTDQPQALSSSPRRVSPWNSAVFWPASVSFLGSASDLAETSAYV